jgi:hypothetical protein
LLEEYEPADLAAGGPAIFFFVARLNHDADLFHPGLNDFFDDQLKSRLRSSTSVDQLLQRQSVLVGCSRRDQRSPNFHRGSLRRANARAA